MPIYQVSGSTREFVNLMDLSQSKKSNGEFSSEELSPKEAAIEADRTLLEKTVSKYSKRENCCGNVSRFFYMVWQAVKRIFGCGSDWQKTTHMLTERIITAFVKEESNVENGVTPEEMKILEKGLQPLVDKILLQVVRDNEAKKPVISKELDEMIGFASTLDRFAESLLTPVALDAFMNAEFKTFLDGLPKKTIKDINNQLFYQTGASKQKLFMQNFKDLCEHPGKLKKLKDNYVKCFNEMQLADSQCKALENNNQSVSLVVLQQWNTAKFNLGQAFKPIYDCKPKD